MTTETYTVGNAEDIYGAELNTREEYEPIFITFNRNSFSHEESTVTGHDGNPHHGSGSTSGYNFLKAYDRAIEMAEKRGEAIGRRNVFNEMHATIAKIAAETQAIIDRDGTPSA